MSKCKGRNVSDILGKGKLAFYNTDDSQSDKYYHIAILCQREKIQGSDLCGLCLEKEKKLNNCKISMSNTLSGATHPSILHGRNDGAIPLWSHIEGGEWFKKMLSKGYKKDIDMVKKVVVDEAKVIEAVGKLKGTKMKKIEELVKQFPELTKIAASNYIGKNKEEKVVTKNIVVSSEEKLLVDPNTKHEAYDIVELIVKPITIHNVDYYYEPKKNKVYTLQYDYIGRYNTKEETLHREYPDSDCEPSIC
jgi:hypothetical protein